MEGIFDHYTFFGLSRMKAINKRKNVMILVILLFSLNTFSIQLGNLCFPKDFAPHRDYSTEWWYQTGVLNDGQYSYEITLFRAYVPKNSKWPKIFGMSVGEIWVVHVMFHDYKSKKRYFKEYTLLPKVIFFFPAVSTSKNGYYLYYSDPHFIVEWKGSFDHIEITFEDKELSLLLELHPKKLPASHNDGIVSMVEGKSYYYSITNVEVKGLVRFNEKWISVNGTSWIDHQWGNFSVHPWEWYSIRLDNNIEIMIYSFPETGFKYASVILDNGKVIKLTGEEFKVVIKGSFKTPTKILRIPMSATVNIPKLGVHLTISAVDKNQFNSAKTTPPYWEGLCRVNGTFQKTKVRGWAFYETW